MTQNMEVSGMEARLADWVSDKECIWHGGKVWCDVSAAGNSWGGYVLPQASSDDPVTYTSFITVSDLTDARVVYCAAVLLFASWQPCRRVRVAMVTVVIFFVFSLLAFLHSMSSINTL